MLNSRMIRSCVDTLRGRSYSFKIRSSSEELGLSSLSLNYHIFKNPNFLEYIPIFKKYCNDDSNKSTCYHCNELRRIIFASANWYQYKQFSWFRASTDQIEFNDISIRDRRLNYHGKELLQDEHPVVVANALGMLHDLSDHVLKESFLIHEGEKSKKNIIINDEQTD